MDAYRTSPRVPELDAPVRAPLRVWVGLAATCALVAGGGAWIALAFGGWALLTQVPTLLMVAAGLFTQIRRNADPRSIAKYRARNEELADAWLRSADPAKAARRALFASRIRS